VHGKNNNPNASSFLIKAFQNPVDLSEQPAQDFLGMLTTLALQLLFQL
jgi:hypothetical protein